MVDQPRIDPERIIAKMQEMIAGMTLELAAQRVALEDARSEINDLRAIVAAATADDES